MQNPNPEKTRKISREVARWLKVQGITQKQAAEMLGISHESVRVQVCNLSFSKKSAAHWSHVLGLNERFLLTGEGVISDRQTGYGKVIRENEELRSIVKAQAFSLKAARSELAIYRSLYGPLPQNNSPLDKNSP